MGLKWSKKPISDDFDADRSPTAVESTLKFDNMDLETFTLVWLDRKLGTTNENAALLDKLRARVHCVRTFTHLETCKFFIEAHPFDEPLVLVISGKYGEELVPLVHNLDQISIIYIFCMNRIYHSVWAGSYAKVTIYSVIQYKLSLLK